MNLRDFPWGPILTVMGILLAFGGVAFLIMHNIRVFEERCQDRGGHVISYRDDSVCVDDDNRIVLSRGGG